jgi:hypothetical protein
MSAWLLKKKSGSAMVRMRQYNKRFFTIDFDSHVFFYSHAEASKKVSSVIRFTDIADVRLPDPHLGEEGNPTGISGEKRTSERRGSKLLRSFSGLSGGGSKPVAKDGAVQAHHFVIVVVKPSMKPMELLCSSAMEAEQWHQALKEAMLFSGDLGDEVGACIPTTENVSGDEEESEAFRTVALSPPTHEPIPSPSVARSTERKPPGAVGTAAMATAKAAMSTPKTAYPASQEKNVESANTPLLSGGYPTLSGEPNATLSQQPPQAPPAISSKPAIETPTDTRLEQSTAPSKIAAPQPAPVPIASAVEATAPAPAKQESIDDEPAPPPQRGTFLDLTTEPIEREAVTKPSPTGNAGPKDPEAVQEVVVETGGLLQQSDFGFEAGEDTESSGSAVSTPRQGAANTFDGLASPTAKPDGYKSSHTPEVPILAVASGRFEDRDRGLSMQERLQNLEFSDDEDYDDDDPLGLKSTAK